MSVTQASLLGDTFGSKASGTIPIGGIIMWSGSVASVPTGWSICNGANGTPNLVDRFIVGAGSGYGVGATGGSADATLVSHSHTASTNTAGTHTHRLLAADNGSATTQTMVSFNVATAGDGQIGGPNTYITNINNEIGPQVIESAGSHSHTVTIDSTGSSETNANLPPYYALAFIMRVS